MPKRYLCWDESFIEKSEAIEIRQHEPIKKEIAFLPDEEWEGVHNGYGAIVKTESGYRFYYRASFSSRRFETENGRNNVSTTCICVMESADGIHFKRPVVGKYEYNGSKFNNIVFMRDPLDNFAVFYDENPDCPADERFKALSETHIYDESKAYVCTRLFYYASADGYDFREMGFLHDVEGVFDSYNVCFFDKEKKEYRLYFRGYHTPDGTDKLKWSDNIDCTNDIRDIRLATSPDFKTWRVHGRIAFLEGQEDIGLYTSNVAPYGRDTGAYVGFPMRYTERGTDMDSLMKMPLADRRRKVIEHFGREGTAITDTLIMTSPDGFLFNRRDESFIRPGIEYRGNWWYGSASTAYGIIETDREEYGAPRELSFFSVENYRIKTSVFRRNTIRLDGFFSYYARYKGGSLLTKPVRVSADSLSVNFSSAGRGGLIISLCNEAGEVLDGYTSPLLFGDSVDRTVDFPEPLSALRGQHVRLRISLVDTHVYSFCFQ